MRDAEIAALKLGIDLGMTLIDTAEMYGDGEAERVVAEAIAGRRDEMFIVSKVLPQNASRTGTIAACERSLKRLNTDRIDLYLLHWRGNYKLKDTLAGFQALVKDGLIKAWGVSNFDVGRHGRAGSPSRRRCRRHQPDAIQPCAARHRDRSAALVQGARHSNHGLLACRPGPHPALTARLPASPRAMALHRRKWRSPGVLLHKDMMVIPKATSPTHVRENRAALDLELTKADLAELGKAFPPPRGRAAARNAVEARLDPRRCHHGVMQFRC